MVLVLNFTGQEHLYPMAIVAGVSCSKKYKKMRTHFIPDPTLAAAITRAASTQTYYTIRFLVDKGLVNDAYQAYAYFRWVDDRLDQEANPRTERLALVKRQQALIESSSHGETWTGLAPEERLLVSLIRRDADRNSGLQTYIRYMMAVMAFDADRRGRLISQHELNEYTRWLSVAVTEAMHYFIGHNCASPHGEIRYIAVTGAHITHMLRDMQEDIDLGYYNIPREVANGDGIVPSTVESAIFRNWVKERVQQARICFKIGKNYLAQVKSLRCRIAGFAYVHRFEAVLDCIEREGYLLRTQYPERTSLRQELEMVGWALWMALKCHRSASLSSINQEN